MKRLTDPQLAARVAQDIPDGAYVNLGIGMPTHVAAHVPEGREVIYHSENGVIGVGPPPDRGQVDPEMIDASKRLHHHRSWRRLLRAFRQFRDDARRAHRYRGPRRLSSGRDRRPGELGDAATKAFRPPSAVRWTWSSGCKTICVMMRHTGQDGSPRCCALHLSPDRDSGVVSASIQPRRPRRRARRVPAGRTARLATTLEEAQAVTRRHDPRAHRT